MISKLLPLKRLFERFLVCCRLKKPGRPVGRIILAAGIIFLAVIILPAVFAGLGIAAGFFKMTGKAEIVVEAGRRGDWPTARQELEGLNGQLGKIRRRLDWLGPLGYLPPIKRNLTGLDQLLLVSQDIVTGYQEVFLIIEGLQGHFQAKEMALSFESPEHRLEFLKALQEEKESFQKVSGEINRAKEDFIEIKTSDFSGIFQSKLVFLYQFLDETITGTETAIPILANLPELGAVGGEKKYLLIFQNNMELRPTGGFIGSYGIITVRNGKIVKIKTNDVYNLDRLAEGKLAITAPEPFWRYNNQRNWYLRDANWSPDWPTAAEKILWFFNQEREAAGLTKIDFDGVIALTPDFIANLLEVVGPLEARGVVFQADNFAMDLEQFVEFDYADYGIPVHQRKAIIGELTEKLMKKVYHLPPEKILSFWLAFKNNIDQKQILVYLTAPELQRYFSQKNWSGELQTAVGDYFLAVDSNFASLKTNSVMEKSFSYQLTADDSGRLTARLEINYLHQGEYLKDLITEYRNYLRVYVPKESWFLKAGLRQNDHLVELGIPEEVDIKEEFGKKYLGFFFTVKPGREKTVVLEYRLPERIAEQYRRGVYNFCVQKQPGSAGHNLKIVLKFNQRVKSYSSYRPPITAENKILGWQSDLKEDRCYLVNF